MKKQKFWKAIVLSSILFLAAPTSANTNVEIDICACEDENRIVVVQNVGEEQHNKLVKLENDLICIRFEAMRVDNTYRKDIAVCTRDENT